MDTQVEAKIKATKTLREIARATASQGNGDYLGLNTASSILSRRSSQPPTRRLRLHRRRRRSQARRRVCA